MRYRFAALICLVLWSRGAFAEGLPAPRPLATSVMFADTGIVEFAPAENGCVIRYTLDGSAPSAKSYVVCAPLKIASTLKVKAATFDAAGKSSETVDVECIRKTADPAAENSTVGAINVDYSEVPEMKEWSISAAKELEQVFPVIVQKFGNSNRMPRQITLLIRKEMKGSGSTSGNDIVLGADHYRKNPKDIGTPVFFLTRIMQNYSARNAPGWLVTGIADYIRWWNYEPAEKRGRIEPKHAKYTNGFGDAAAFLVWIEKTHDKEVIKKLSEALFSNKYSDDLFKEIAGKNAPALWEDFIASLIKEAEEAAAKLIDKSIEKPQPASTTVTFSDIGNVEFAAPAKGLTLRYTLDGTSPNAKSFACGSPIRVASSLKVRAAAFNAEGRCSESVEVQCVYTPPAEKAPDAKPTAAVNVDFSATPDLREWALNAQQESEKYYPAIVEMLKSEGFAPSRQITLIFVEEVPGLGPTIPAFAIHGESKIFFRAGHIRGNVKDMGMVIHELTHVIQAYGYGRNAPSWLVEGIADYVRWENWEKPQDRRRVNPMKAKYTNGYNETASFLAWTAGKYDKEIVLKLNAALRKGAYKDELFKTITGKPIPDLWKEFIESLTAK